MEVLSGWKEIAEHLHTEVRTAQRWERLGLPVRRVSKSDCSPVIAVVDEIEQWARLRYVRSKGFDSSLQSSLKEFRTARRRTRRLLRQVRFLRREHNRLLSLLTAQVRS